MTYRVYLPLVPQREHFLTGLYEIDTLVAEVDAAAGIHHHLIGDFVDIEDLIDTAKIESRWQNGYTNFVNLMTTRTAQELAEGCCDAAITNYATGYKEWQDLGNGRTMFIAPLPEMNGDWTSYGYDPNNFKLAFGRIRQIFDGMGATALLVFAPNGWSVPPYAIADYYPGNTLTNYVAFSGYNWGGQSPEVVFGEYVAEMRAITNKPLLISQYGSCSAGGDKEAWIRNAFAFFRANQIKGAIWFNTDKECDWAVMNNRIMSAAYINEVR